MRKNAFFDNIALDVKFYTSFYGISGDIQTVRDHYSTVGLAKQLLPNLQCYAKLLSVVLDFDIDVFVTNGGIDLGDRLICENHPDAHKNNDLVYFMNLFYDDIMSETTANGQINCALMRCINCTDVINYNKKWDTLISDLHKHVAFDEQFYLFFYKDIANNENPFFDWLTDGVFKGRHPNMNSYNKQMNMLSDLSSFLHNNNIDLNFIMKSNYDNINRICSKLVELSEVERPLYVFFNLCRKKRMFWSEAEQLAYVEKHKTKFTDTLKWLKAMNHYDIDKLVQIVDAKQKIHAENVKKIATKYVNNVKYTVQHLDSYWSLVKKVTNPRYIETFKVINKLDGLPKDEMLHNLLLTLISNIIDVKDTESNNLNVMQIKSFVLSFFYNTLLSEKPGKSKTDYLNMVKSNAVKFLLELFNKKNVTVDEISLVTDLDFLISNKKFIKLTRFLMKLAMLFL
jgi:hypothetical protein